MEGEVRMSGETDTSTVENTVDISGVENLQTCTNCKRSLNKSEFIGVKGNNVRRCKRCRDKDARQKQRPEVKEKRNERQKEKQYYKKYREKKRGENEEEFLRHNAEVAREWRNKNSEHVAEWKRKNFIYKVTACKDQAREKGIPWELTDEVAENLMIQPCTYCNHFNLEDSLNGINRLNVHLGYTPENCVSSCTKCTFIKKCLDPNTFIKRCIHISNIHSGHNLLHPNAWPLLQKSVSYNDYKKRAIEKGLDFEVEETTFKDIRKNACYYCNRYPTIGSLNGIDRMNNAIGYLSNNIVSCCGECNSMKADLESGEFIQKCKDVSANSHSKIWNNQPEQKLNIIKRLIYV